MWYTFYVFLNFLSLCPDICTHTYTPTQILKAVYFKILKSHKCSSLHITLTILVTTITEILLPQSILLISVPESWLASQELNYEWGYVKSSTFAPPGGSMSQDSCCKFLPLVYQPSTIPQLLTSTSTINA